MAEYEDGAYHWARFQGQPTIARVRLSGNIDHIPAGIAAWLRIGSEVPLTTGEFEWIGKAIEWTTDPSYYFGMRVELDGRDGVIAPYEPKGT